MNLLELKRQVDQAILSAGSRAETMEVRIVVRRDFAVGGTPSVPVKAVSCGFDWDHTKFLITPEQNLKEWSK